MLGKFESESIYSGWMHVSVILLTTSLLLYHMISVGSIKIPKKMGAFITCSMILIDILYTVNSIIPYYRRSSEELKDYKNKSEYITRDIYFIGGILFIIAELFICYYIIYNSLDFAGL